MATRPDAATLRKLAAQGKALKNAKGKPSFYIRNAADLDNAISAVGRVRPNTDEARAKVRRFVMGEAKKIGLSSRIPDSWDSSGNLKDGGDDSSSGSGSSSQSGSSKVYDPDHDGDNDATPAGDTDHSHWSAAGKQLKPVPVPGKPMSPQAVKAARIFAKRGKAA